MSSKSLATSVGASARPPLPWPLVVTLLWALVAALFVARTILSYGATPLYGDSDDAMRMATTLDLMAGADWFDPVVARDNTPFGASLHWSKLLDLPIAGLIAMVRPLFGPLAPDAAATIWPLLLLLPLMLLTVRITRHLVPAIDTVTPAALTVVSLVLLIEFLPGRIDHHSVQIVCTLTALAALLCWRHTIVGALASGAAAALSLAIGLETLPFQILLVAGWGLCWCLYPATQRAPLRAFAASFALSALLFFLATTAPANYLARVCDAHSIVYVVATSLAAAALLGATMLPTRFALPARLGATAGLGALAIAVIALAFPECLRGPYGMADPRILATFLTIPETHPFWMRLLIDPVAAIAFVLPSALALVIALRRAYREAGRAKIDWYLLFAFLATACAIAMVQIRGARFSAALAIPALSYFVLAARTAFLASPGVFGTIRLVATWIVSAGIGIYAVFMGIALALPKTPLTPSPFGRTQAAAAACFPEPSYTALAVLPAARVVTGGTIGAHVLRHTRHSVVSAGFHRNTDGMLDQIAFFSGPETEARGIAERRGVTLVAYCLPLLMPSAADNPTSFMALLDEGRHWDWLKPLTPPDEPIQILEIVRADP